MPHNVRTLIRSNGHLQLTHSTVKPCFGKVIGTNNVPDNVLPVQAMRKLAAVAFLPSSVDRFEADICPDWAQIAHLTQGDIYRY